MANPSQAREAITSLLSFTARIHAEEFKATHPRFEGDLKLAARRAGEAAVRGNRIDPHHHLGFRELVGREDERTLNLLATDSLLAVPNVGSLCIALFSPEPVLSRPTEQRSGIYVHHGIDAAILLENRQLHLLEAPVVPEAVQAHIPVFLQKAGVSVPLAPDRGQQLVAV